MRSHKNISKHWFGGLLVALLGMLSINVAHAQIFVANTGNGTIGEYTTSGATVNASLISDLNSPDGIAVVATPEPSTWALLLSGLGMLVVGRLSQARFAKRTFRD